MDDRQGAEPRNQDLRPAEYHYFELLKRHLGGGLSEVFSGRLVYPRQLEIHLPADRATPCNFHCYYCQGKLLAQEMGQWEDKGLRLLDELGGRVPYCIYGGVYTEPLMNPRFMDYLRLTKRHGSSFGIHTNGSLLKKLEGDSGFLSELCRISSGPQDYLSVSLDAGAPESHMLTKNLDQDWFTDIIEGLRMAVSARGTRTTPKIRVCYLLNKHNSSEAELSAMVETARRIGVDTLRFSIPYEVYGKDFEEVRRYKGTVEVGQRAEYERRLSRLLSKDREERPFVFYISPEHQDVDRMHFLQCVYGYYQITFGADGWVYRCSSTATPSFAMNRLGCIPEALPELEAMMLRDQDPAFRPSTCFAEGARCNRMALEINARWASRDGAP